MGKHIANRAVMHCLFDARGFGVWTQCVCELHIHFSVSSEKRQRLFLYVCAKAQNRLKHSTEGCRTMGGKRLPNSFTGCLP